METRINTQSDGTKSHLNRCTGMAGKLRAHHLDPGCVNQPMIENVFTEMGMDQMYMESTSDARIAVQIAILSIERPSVGSENMNSLWEYDDSPSNASTQEDFEQSCFNSDESYSLVLITINDFKRINKFNGRRYGDVVFMRLADILRNEIPEGKVYSIGDDEFVILLPDSQVSDLCETVHSHIRQNDYFFVSEGAVHSRHVGIKNPAKGLADYVLFHSKEFGENRIAG